MLPVHPLLSLFFIVFFSSFFLHCSATVKPSQKATLVLACDGIFDVMSDEQVAALVQGAQFGADPTQLSQSIIDKSLEMGTKDNLTVACVHL